MHSAERQVPNGLFAYGFGQRTTKGRKRTVDPNGFCFSDRLPHIVRSGAANYARYDCERGMDIRSFASLPGYRWLCRSAMHLHKEVSGRM